jgi:hypothetical protein
METNQDEHRTPDEIEETANSGAYDAGAETDTAVGYRGKGLCLWSLLCSLRPLQVRRSAVVGASSARMSTQIQRPAQEGRRAAGTQQ